MTRATVARVGGSVQRQGVSAPFYFPRPDLFGKKFAWEQYTTYAARLEDAGLADHFPSEDDLRFLTVELLVDRYRVEDVIEQPHLIDTAVEDARAILAERST
jgi:hypothetical protein